MNNIMKEFVESGFFNLLFGKHDVIMIYLSGSNLTGLTDERSDFDIVVITQDDSDSDHSDLFIMYNDLQKIHWYNRSIEKFVDDGILFRSVGAVEFSQISNDFILYKNHNYLDKIETLKAQKDNICKIGCFDLYNGLIDKINSILLNNSVESEDKTKFLYQLCYASCWLNNEPQDAEKLKDIKRIVWTDISEEEEVWLITKLQALQDYMVANKDFDLESLRTEIIEKIK